jgi:hypothetical protein
MKLTSMIPAAAAFLITLSSANAGLAAHYEFEETSGTTLGDSSGNGHDGTVVGSTGDLDVAGIVGASAYKPGGIGSYGRVTDGVSTFGIGGNNARTISFWFRTPDFGPGSQYRVIGLGTGAAGAFNIVAEADTGANRIGLRYGNGNVYFNADNSGTAFAVDTWYHVAAVYDGTTLDLESIGTATDGNGLTFYVNGTAVNAAAGNLSNPTQALNTALTDFMFGANEDGNNGANAQPYPGLVDEVRVYDNALSASEVAALATIPEPSAALLGLVGCGLLLVRRRRR